jgi:hypothetical protein
MAVLLFLGLVILLSLAIVVVPRILYPVPSSIGLDKLKVTGKARLDAQNDRLKLQNDARTGLIQAVGGGVVLLGVFFTWRQLQLSQQGQLTDRFTNAVGQLGHDKLDVRLGGIHGLERIAQESVEDHPAISSILSAYVRRESPWPPSVSGQYREDAPLASVPDMRHRAPSIHAALIALDSCQKGRRESLRLSDTDLRKATLSGVRFDNAMMNRAHLEGAVLNGADLESALLINACLDGVTLKNANLTNAYLWGAQLEGASDLDRANFQGASADPRTTWPSSFDSASAGVTIFNEELSLEYTTGPAKKD